MTDEFEIHPALSPGKERNATANQHRVDPGPVLVDQTQLARLGGESRAADRDFALSRFGSQSLDFLRQATDARRAFPCTADSEVESTTFGSAFQIAANSSVE